MSGKHVPHLGNRAKDDYLYEEDAVFVGILIHGGRVCIDCGTELPDSQDYFSRDTRKDDAPLKGYCKRCKRVRERARHAAKVGAR